MSDYRPPHVHNEPEGMDIFDGIYFWFFSPIGLGNYQNRVTYHKERENIVVAFYHSSSCHNQSVSTCQVVYYEDKVQCKGCKKIFDISPKHLIFLAKMTLFGK